MFGALDWNFPNTWTIAMARTTKRHQATAATVGHEAELWRMADTLRGSMDAAEYKHVVLGLIFLKYISDAFEAQHAQLEAERDQSADPEDPDEHRVLNINDCFPDLQADDILANPPLTVSDWRGDLLLTDQRCQFGVPPAGNANFAGVQHMVYHPARRD